MRTFATAERGLGGPTYNVVVTGGTKGIGKALAAEFLRAGDNVAVCSREEARVQATIEELSNLARPTARLTGRPVNVACAGDVAAFADYVSEGRFAHCTCSNSHVSK